MKIKYSQSTMPMHSSDEEEVIERGECLPYNKYPKIDLPIKLPIKNTKFSFKNRYVVMLTHSLDQNSDLETVLVIYGSSDKYGHRNVQLIYKENCYIVKSAFYETLEQVEELLNELQMEMAELNGQLPVLL